MSLTILFRPLARLELDEAMGWYERQKTGLGVELKEAVDQMLARIVETPGRFHPVRGEVRRALLRRFPYAIHFLAQPEAHHYPGRLPHQARSTSSRRPNLTRLWA